MCDCIARVNEKIKDFNTEISIGIDFVTGKSTPPMIVTTKANHSSRVKPKRLFASFCPLCGVKLGADGKENDHG